LIINGHVKEHRRLIIVTNISFWERKIGAHERIFRMASFLASYGLDILIYYTGDKKIPNDYENTLFSILSSKQLRSKIPKQTALVFRVSGWLKEMTRVTKHLLKHRTPHETNHGSWHANISEVDRYVFNQVVKKIEPHYILVEYIWLTRFITGLKYNLRQRLIAIIDTHDVISDRTSQFDKENRLLQQRANVEQEAEALRHYDLIIAIQKHDAEKFRDMLPFGSVIIAHHAHPINSPVKASDRKPIHLLFVGSQSAPNTDGLNLFLEHVWQPLIDTYADDLILHIVGSVSNNSADFYSRKNLIIHGMVDSVDEYYEKADIVIAPLTYGTGLKIKVVEALCFSKPLVTTNIGAEGLETARNQAFLVADNWNDFCLKTMALIDSTEQRNKMAQSAYEFSNSMFTEAIAYKPLTDKLGL